MTDPSQRQLPQIVPPNILAPCSIGVEPVGVPGTPGYVALQVFQSHGVFVCGMDAKSAIEIGKRIIAAARTAISGLTIVGDAGSE